ncbi:MAG: HD domain-containing phosphohydrolase [Nitrospirota bacterium]|nr:HD domain-containing phosphohydrolase [Nitrospirota bacterium]
MAFAKAFISTLMSAISNCSLYSKDHISVDNLTKKSIAILDELLTDKDSLEIMVVEDNLVVNKTPARNAGHHGSNLIKRLKRKGISRIDFLKGISYSELKQFIADLSDPEKKLRTYPHIKTGIVDVRIGGYTLASSLENISAEQVERVKELYHNIAPHKELNISGLEEIVVNFIVTFKREANILKLISPVKAYSEYTYTHATNVAILSMFQAESLGARDDLLHDIGIAALLHDVGKLFISKEILEKTGKLDKKEWEEIKMHSLYGARYLAKIDGLTQLAPIAALEHHLRYDCKGYPQLNAGGTEQHFCSQIIATSDFFDALRSRRPYKRDWQIKEIIALMKENAGSEFNPFLVDNFSRTLLKALKKG